MDTITHRTTNNNNNHHHRPKSVAREEEEIYDVTIARHLLLIYEKWYKRFNYTRWMVDGGVYYRKRYLLGVKVSCDHIVGLL